MAGLDLCTDIIAKVVSELLGSAFDHLHLHGVAKHFQHYQCSPFAKGMTTGFATAASGLVIVVMLRHYRHDAVKEYHKLKREYEIHDELINRMSSCSNEQVEKWVKARTKYEEAKDKVHVDTKDNVIVFGKD